VIQHELCHIGSHQRDWSVAICTSGVVNAGTHARRAADQTHRSRRGRLAAGVDIAQAKGPWYRDIGQGMGAALNAASATNAYVLSDRGTWLSFKNRGDLTIAVQGDPRLFKQYGVILVNPTKHPHVKADLGQAFVDWITSPEGQAAIAGYKINGEQLFYPNAGEPGA
jgi:tungstate transport system substrate-binding protein